MFSKYFNITNVTPQTTILGILDSVSNDSCFANNKVFINLILLIFKLYVCYTFVIRLLYVYKSSEKKFININNLTAEIRKIKRMEKETALNNSNDT